MRVRAGARQADAEGGSVNAIAAVVAAALIVAGVAFVYVPAALVVAGLLIGADALFDLRGDG